MKALTLSDLIPVEKWRTLEREFNQRSGLNASVFDTEGIRITDYKKWANDLCPAIKMDKKGQSFICSIAHQNLAAQARSTRQPVVGECDAGLLKLVVPIFVRDCFLGVLGGCGLLDMEGEVDTYLIEKTTDIDDEDILSLTEDIPQMTDTDKTAAIAFLEEQRDKIVKSYRTHSTCMNAAKE